MESSTQAVSSLRQRMIEDMRMRKLAPKTQTAYIRSVRKLAKYLGRSPDTATEEDLRRFQLYMVDEGTSSITLNATIVGLNFLFTVTLGRPDLMARMQSVRVPLKLPVILSKDEVARLIAPPATSSTRSLYPWPMGRVCASVKCSRSRSPILTVNA